MRRDLCTMCGQLPSHLVLGWSDGMWSACAHWPISGRGACWVLSDHVRCSPDHIHVTCDMSAAPCKSSHWAICSAYRWRELVVKMLVRICESWILAIIKMQHMSKHKKIRFIIHYVKPTAQLLFKVRFPKGGPTCKRQVVNPRHQTPQRQSVAKPETPLQNIQVE